MVTLGVGATMLQGQRAIISDWGEQPRNLVRAGHGKCQKVKASEIPPIIPIPMVWKGLGTDVQDTTTAGTKGTNTTLPASQPPSLQLTVPTVVPEGAKISKALRDVNSGVN